MLKDIKHFNKDSVIDTCSVLNLLSSEMLYRTTINKNINFIISDFIEYELIYKRRNIKNESKNRVANELDKKIISAIQEKKIGKYALSLNDLHDPIFLEHGKRKSIGELTGLILARKFQIGLVTDDHGAQKIASKIIGADKVDSICSLISWLFYNDYLSDTDKDVIIGEQEYYYRNQKDNFEKAYRKGLEQRLMCK